eukprot:gnl/Spiro4/12046_TR6354_c0_g1_i1.p1 gnl/Spiro4/12046_TR6354_c0_g1~~gnl/Spiro4/12046_TR6354_c0_g1_i1.p1  ORF type:complete len:669 (+),score=164.44 gnl/Spiro4/12046_TR6354_c0_g1_i1:77-2083(+)
MIYQGLEEVHEDPDRYPRMATNLILPGDQIEVERSAVAEDEEPDPLDDPSFYPRLAKLAAGPIIAFPFLFNLLPIPNPEPSRCLFLMIWMGLWWIFEPVPSPIVSLLPLFLAPLLRIASASQIAHAYFSDASVFMFGTGIFSAAIQQLGLHNRLTLFFLRRTDGRADRVVLALVVVAALVAMVVPRSAAAALIAPFVNAVSAPLDNSEVGLSFKRGLYLAVQYALGIGSATTLIGNPCNLILVGQFSTLFPDHTPISFGSWFFFCFPLACIFIFLEWRIFATFSCPGGWGVALRKRWTGFVPTQLDTQTHNNTTHAATGPQHLQQQHAYDYIAPVGLPPSRSNSTASVSDLVSRRASGSASGQRARGNASSAVAGAAAAASALPSTPASSAAVTTAEQQALLLATSPSTLSTDGSAEEAVRQIYNPSIFISSLGEPYPFRADEKYFCAFFSILFVLWLSRAPSLNAANSQVGWGAYFLSDDGLQLVSDATLVLLVGVLLIVPLPGARHGVFDWDEFQHKQHGAVWSGVMHLGGALALADAMRVSGLAALLCPVDWLQDVPPYSMLTLVVAAAVLLAGLLPDLSCAGVVAPLCFALGTASGQHPLFFAIPVTLSGSFGSAELLGPPGYPRREMFWVCSLVTVIGVGLLLLWMDALGVLLWGIGSPINPE